MPQLITDDIESMIGNDAEAMAARETMPHPAQYNSYKFQAIAPADESEPFSFNLSLKTFTRRMRVLTFRQVRVVLRTGGCFLAWEYERDRKIYL